MARYIYDYAEAAGLGRDLLGGKGAGLSEMTAIGLPVPPGFIIATSASVEYMNNGHELPDGVKEEVAKYVTRLEKTTGTRFGYPDDPLLVSVRSGGAISMPGMMDTILNLGLNDETTEGLARKTQNRRFAYDAYRRLIQMFGNVVEGVDAELFEGEIRTALRRNGVSREIDLSPEELSELIERFKRVYADSTGWEFPQDPAVQLTRAIRAVLESWDSPRANVYRQANGISDTLGTAVNVVQMVFGNKGEGSGTGVAFTRNPSTGERGMWGEYLSNAQGEDIVSGARTPEPLEAMRERLPEAHEQLLEAGDTLERHYRDMQDIEFTVEEGHLYLLQTRSGKRTAAAALKIGVDMVDEGLIGRDEVVKRIEPSRLDDILHPTINPDIEHQVIAIGLNASPGAAVGRVVMDADKAEEWGRRGEDVILVRWETTPDDIHGLIQARGVLTVHGGMTSHAAVVARGMGKPCVVGCGDLVIDIENRSLSISGRNLVEGDVITINGATGEVIAGAAELVPPEIDPNMETVLSWADARRDLSVYANADSAEDAARAREFGAQGIGLCRTEHMFMAPDRLGKVRAMIMATSEIERRKHLDALLPMQQSDFEGIFLAMEGLPVTIRLLDPPLHEFLPRLEDAETPEMAARIKSLTEANPMLGTRGCRIGLMYPEIYEMQVRAIIRAAHAVEAKTGKAPLVEIMHPLVAFAAEFRRLRDLTDRVAAEENAGEYRVGTMIELPSACLRAGEIAELADFLSFGTNDLTQTTLGFSRDDAEGRFLSYYLGHHILDANPFETLDIDGVGELMRIAVERARKVKPDIKIGICGEHGGDPASVAFCHRLGLDYVSCSPYRVPLARLAAGQAAVAGNPA